jgi:hypothetical protein
VRHIAFSAQFSAPLRKAKGGATEVSGHSWRGEALATAEYPISSPVPMRAGEGLRSCDAATHDQRCGRSGIGGWDIGRVHETGAVLSICAGLVAYSCHHLEHDCGLTVFQHALRDGARGDCLEAAGLALPTGAFNRLAQTQESRGARS